MAVNWIVFSVWKVSYDHFLIDLIALTAALVVTHSPYHAIVRQQDLCERPTSLPGSTKVLDEEKLVD